MKKLILSVAVVLAVVSCTKKETTEAQQDANAIDSSSIVTPSVADSTSTETAQSSEAKFSDETVNKKVDEYKQLLVDFAAAVDAKDQKKLGELNTQYQNWAKDTATWTPKIKAEEKKMWNNVMIEGGQAWVKAATKLQTTK